jgi:hypothetical protein
MKGLYNQDWIKTMGKQNDPYIHKCKVCGKVKQVRQYFPKYLSEELLYNDHGYSYNFLLPKIKKWVEWNKHPKASMEYKDTKEFLRFLNVEIPEDKQNAAIISAERS